MSTPIISAHISYAEATKSDTGIRKGIDNTPMPHHLKAMQLVAAKCFEPLRLVHGKPIGITSFFRSVALNEELGGAKHSGHMDGEAIDIDADLFNNGITNAQIFQWLGDNVVYDKLIWEFGNDDQPAWVHVAHRATDNRMISLKAVRVKQRNGKLKTEYIPFYT